MGRSYLTLELHERFVALIADGWTVADAAAECNLGRRTVFSWLRRGRDALERWDTEGLDETERGADPDWETAQFALDVDRRGASVRGELAGIVLAGARKDPKFALEVLARLDPEHWGRTLKPGETYLRDKGRADDGDLSELLQAGDALVAELAARAEP